MIFIDPDRTQYPDNFQATPNPGLEHLTGADMCISKLPLPVSQSSLDTHIKNHSLFVQIKIDYDCLSFDAIHNFCARVQAAKIPQQQAILLRVGEHWQDENGLFRIKNQKPYGKTKFADYRCSVMATMARGVTVYPENLTSIEELPQWIEDYQATLEKIEKEGKREVYPPRVPPVFEVDDIWQMIEEVPPNTWEYFICAGLHGMGQKTVQNIRDYFQDTLARVPDGWHVLKVLAEEDEKGNGVHKVANWGDGKRKNLRDLLMIPDGWNIDLLNDFTTPYQSGWKAALWKFKALMDEGKNPKDAFNACMLLADETIEF